MAARVVKVVPGKTAFFVCDIQERFRTAIHGYPSLINTAEKMVKAAGLLKIPVLTTEQNPKALGATVPLPFEGLPDELKPAAIPKTKFSMVLPEVEQKLREWQTQSVVLFGIESHVCVLQTALDLLERNINVHVLADGVSSCNAEEVPIALALMREAGVQVTTSESILFQLMVDASHPSFKAVSGLIKEQKSTTTEALKTLSPLGKL